MEAAEGGDDDGDKVAGQLRELGDGDGADAVGRAEDYFNGLASKVLDFTSGGGENSLQLGGNGAKGLNRAVLDVGKSYKRCVLAYNHREIKYSTYRFAGSGG